MFLFSGLGRFSLDKLSFLTTSLKSHLEYDYSDFQKLFYKPNLPLDFFEASHLSQKQALNYLLDGYAKEQNFQLLFSNQMGYFLLIHQGLFLL